MKQFYFIYSNYRINLLIKNDFNLAAHCNLYLKLNIIFDTDYKTLDLIILFISFKYKKLYITLYKFSCLRCDCERYIYSCLICRCFSIGVLNFLKYWISIFECKVRIIIIKDIYIYIYK